MFAVLALVSVTPTGASHILVLFWTVVHCSIFITFRNLAQASLPLGCIHECPIVPVLNHHFNDISVDSQIIQKPMLQQCEKIRLSLKWMNEVCGISVVCCTVCGEKKSTLTHRIRKHTSSAVHSAGLYERWCRSCM